MTYRSTLPIAGSAIRTCTRFAPNGGPGSKVGIVGIGGLGHMGIKLAHAMGAHTVAFTTSESKRADAKTLGADEVIVSRNADEMQAHTLSFDIDKAYDRMQKSDVRYRFVIDSASLGK